MKENSFNTICYESNARRLNNQLNNVHFERQIVYPRTNFRKEKKPVALDFGEVFQIVIYDLLCKIPYLSLNYYIHTRTERNQDPMLYICSYHKIRFYSPYTSRLFKFFYKKYNLIQISTKKLQHARVKTLTS